MVTEFLFYYTKVTKLFLVTKISFCASVLKGVGVRRGVLHMPQWGVSPIGI